MCTSKLMHVLIKLTDFGRLQMWTTHVLLLVLCVKYAQSYKIGLSIMCKPDEAGRSTWFSMIPPDMGQLWSVHLALHSHYRSPLPTKCHQHALGHRNALSVRFQFAANMLGSRLKHWRTCDIKRRPQICPPIAIVKALEVL